MQAAGVKAKRDHDLFMHQLHSPKVPTSSPHHKGFTANILHSDKNRPTTAKHVGKSKVNKQHSTSKKQKRKGS
jgi:hypothetical protein